jgi:hypothetical protein
MTADSTQIIWRGARAFASVVAVIIAMAAAPAVAQDGETNGLEPESFRVAVVALDDGTKSGATTDTVSSLLDDAKFDVVAGERLESMLNDRQSRSIPSSVKSKFSGLTTAIAAGVEKFFYKGNNTAVERLAPLFDMGMSHPEVLARRPDYAQQVFEAGIVLIRAYKNLDQEDNARAVARLMIKTLPGLEASPATAPPKIVRYLQQQRETVGEDGTRLAVDIVDGEDCTTYVNGSPVQEREYVVAHEVSYYLTMDCGGDLAPVWRVDVKKGATATAPVAPEDPMSFVMKDGTFRQRRSAEAYLRMVAHYADVPRVLGVSRELGDGDENLLVLRVERGGDALWSDSTDETKVRRVLAKVMPEYQMATSQPVGDLSASASTESRKPDWLGWGFVGGGVVAAGVGTFLVVGASGIENNIYCAPNFDPDTHDIDCSRWDQYTARQSELPDDFVDSELARAQRQRIIGWTVVGVGALGVGFGTYRLLKSGSAEISESANRVLMLPTLGPNQAGLQLRF